MRSISIATYAALRKQVEQTLLLGQQRIEEAKVQTYWNTGRLIKEHILANKDRADYGERVIFRLSGDLEIDSSVLKRVRKFYELFPKGAARHLSWAHYRALIAVPDEKKRLALADQASKGDWSSRDLGIKIRNFLWDERARASDGKAPSLLSVPVAGSFYTYKILQPETTDERMLIDLGFSCNRYLDAVTRKSFKAGDIVTSVKVDDDQYKLNESRGASPESLFTYSTRIEKIVDGDTLRVVVDLGFDTTTRQYLRLKGIDCPEMDTKEGVAAKKFVETILKGVEYLTVKTVKSDKYDRYLADVMVPRKDGTYLYLNNELIEKGMAVKVRE